MYREQVFNIKLGQSKKKKKFLLIQKAKRILRVCKYKHSCPEKSALQTLEKHLMNEKVQFRDRKFFVSIAKTNEGVLMNDYKTISHELSKNNIKRYQKLTSYVCVLTR